VIGRSPDVVAPVLLVEDNPDDVLLTRRAFGKAGLVVDLTVATDGDAAVAKLESPPFPRLILLDWKLPRRSGLEVLRWIRQQPCLAAVPVVVLTSSRLQDDIDLAYQSGANSYLQKPVDLGQLVELLDRLHLYWLHTNVTSAD
jgi:CheY-like chemotaxis protein